MIVDTIDLLQELGWIGFSGRLRRLSDAITQEVLTVYRDQGVDFELRYAPVLLILHQKNQVISQEIAANLGFSRAAVSQIMVAMLKDDLITETPDPQDRRKRWLSLTSKGAALVAQLQPIWQQAERVFQQLAKETDLDLLGTLDQLEAALARRPLSERFTTIASRVG